MKKLTCLTAVRLLKWNVSPWRWMQNKILSYPHYSSILAPVLFIFLLFIAQPLLAAKAVSFDDFTPPIQIAIALTLIPLIPFLLLTLTSFTRIIIVFSMLRNALTTRSVPPNQVLIALALFMTFYIMKPTFETMYNDAITPYINKDISSKEAIDRGIAPLRTFMLKQVREEDLALFVHFAEGKKPTTVAEIPFTTIMPAFITSELRISFEMGFLIYLPFLIIDLVLASILLSMGMFMVPPMMISAPLKLLLFILVNGWDLIVKSLITSFR
ncbi:MAG: flagellar type III secretion system pore protein FliP [bacterium]|nr:flagellar type III secretion system pore protein FliP [bacterium]